MEAADVKAALPLCGNEIALPVCFANMHLKLDLQFGDHALQ